MAKAKATDIEKFTTVIKAGKSAKRYWLDLFTFRELLYFLAWRDILVRYKQTVIGILWAIIRPLLTVIIFTFVFGRIAKMPSQGVMPYALMVLAGQLPWQFFASSFQGVCDSVITNNSLISKIYFPRMIIPFSTVATGFVDFLISLVIMVALLIYYHFLPSIYILLMPLLVLWVVGVIVGPGLFFAALNVKYRDFKYVVPFAVQLGLYISPVGYTSGIILGKWKLLYALNPMVGVIDCFRFMLTGDMQALYWPGLAVSAAVTIVFLWIGVKYFRKMEKTFADEI